MVLAVKWIMWTAAAIAACAALYLLFWAAVAAVVGAASLFRRAADRCGSASVAMLLAVSLAVMYGGGKSILGRFSCDDGLAVVYADFTRATNEVDDTTLEIRWTGADESQQIWVREVVTEAWKSFPSGVDDAWVSDGRAYANGTNAVSFHISAGVAASNATKYAMWHVGSTPPPVEIVDGDGISILSFGSTSHQVSVEYGVNPSALGNILNHAVIESAETDGIWREMWREVVMPSVTNNWTNAVEFTGFWVGRTTRWRARLEVVTP